MSSTIKLIGDPVIAIPSHRGEPVPDKTWDVVKGRLFQGDKAPSADLLMKAIVAIPAEEIRKEEGQRLSCLLQREEVFQDDIFLRSAILGGNQDFALRLIQLGVGNSFLHSTDKEQRTLLHLACERNMTAVAMALMNRGLRADIQDSEGTTALHLACKNGMAGIIPRMMQEISNPNILDTKNRTPLHYACEAGHEKIAFDLIEGGLDPHLVDKDRNPAFLLAMKNGHTALASRILRRYISTAYVKKTTGITRMGWACILRDLSLIRYVIQVDGIKEAQNKSGNTHLHTALKKGYFDVALELLKGGANLYAKNAAGVAPIELMVQLGSSLPSEIREFLRDNGVDLEKIIQTRLLGNIWEFDRTVSHEQEFSYSLEGLSAINIYDFYPSYVQDYFRDRASELPISSEIIIGAFAHMRSNQTNDPSDLIKRMENGAPIVLLTGWDGGTGGEDHATGVMIAQYEGRIFLFKCNRGNLAINKNPGVEVFEMAKAENLPLAISKLQKCKEDSSYFYEGINEELGLSIVSYLPLLGQTIGNCPVASTEALLFSSLYWEFLKVSSSSEEAEEKARWVLEDFIAYSKERSVTQYVESSSEPYTPVLMDVLQKTATDPSLALAKRRPAIHTMVSRACKRRQKKTS